MKSVSGLFLLALIIGCGEGAPSEPTPEAKAEMDTKMADDMKKMTGNLTPTPGGPDAAAPGAAPGGEAPK